MKIFITGGTGFLGKEVVSKLLEQDNELYLLTRRKISDELYQNKKIKLIEGSLENIEHWSEQLTGMDVVLHRAAPVVFWGKWSMYQSLIVDATKKIYTDSIKYGVKKFIYISSESVLQDKKYLIDIDENEPYPIAPNSFYGKSKMLAEQEILKEDSPMTRIILRPTFIWGDNVYAVEQLSNQVKAGKFMWMDQGETWIEMVHVKNVAQAIALSITHGKDKEIYFVTDGNPQRAKVFFTALLKKSGVVIPNKSISYKLIRPIASLIELTWKIGRFKSNPPLTRFDLAFIGMSRRYSINKIKRDMEYNPINYFKQINE